MPRNEARTYRHIEVVPASGSLGAEIRGVNVAAGLDGAVIAEIRQALLDHLVIFFRDQKLAPREQLAFAQPCYAAFQLGFARVYAAFARRGLHEQVVFVGGGKLGLPDNAVVAFALGCDLVNVAREAMLAIGCIQAQKCHTDTCPTGVATQNAWLSRGLDPRSSRCEPRTTSAPCGVIC